MYFDVFTQKHFYGEPKQLFRNHGLLDSFSCQHATCCHDALEFQMVFIFNSILSLKATKVQLFGLFVTSTHPSVLSKVFRSLALTVVQSWCRKTVVIMHGCRRQDSDGKINPSFSLEREEFIRNKVTGQRLALEFLTRLGVIITGVKHLFSMHESFS